MTHGALYGALMDNYGECNDAGRELLAFLSSYEAMVHLIHEEEHSEADMGTPKVKAVALY